MPTIIDFHTHCFPDALAPRAMAQLTANASACGYTPHTDGTVDGLLASMARGGITRSVVCNIATNARQMPKVNDFAMELARRYPSLISLGSLHPSVPQAELETELARLAAAGLPGIKIHPDYVGVTIHDPAYDPILSLCEARGLFVITHAGFDPVSPDKLHCTPDMVLAVMRAHPHLKLVVAHTGGFDCETEVLEKLCGTKVFIDTSLSAVRASRDPAYETRCAAILRAHDPDRLLFATDTPWSTPTAELAFIRRVGLSTEIEEKILHENAERLIASCV